MKRIGVIDQVKGVGILLVLLGHSGLEGIPRQLIYAFHMPLFFIISDYLFDLEKWNVQKWKEFVKKRLKNYLLVYVFIYIFHLIVFKVVLGLFQTGVSMEYVSNIKHYFIGMFWGRGGTKWMPECTPIWFLPCIFFTNIIYFWASRVQWKWVLAISFVLSGLFIFYDVKLPGHLEIAMSSGLAFMVIGNWVRKWDIVSRLNGVTAWILGIIGTACALFNSSVDLNNDKFGNLLLFYMASVLLTLALFYCCSKWLFECRWLSFLGRETLIIMGFHYSANLLFRKIASAVVLPFQTNIDSTWILVFAMDIPAMLILIYMYRWIKDIFRRKKYAEN